MLLCLNTNIVQCKLAHVYIVLVFSFVALTMGLVNAIYKKSGFTINSNMKRVSSLHFSIVCIPNSMTWNGERAACGGTR